MDSRAIAAAAKKKSVAREGKKVVSGGLTLLYRGSREQQSRASKGAVVGRGLWKERPLRHKPWQPSVTVVHDLRNNSSIGLVLERLLGELDGLMLNACEVWGPKIHCISYLCTLFGFPCFSSLSTPYICTFQKLCINISSNPPLQLFKPAPDV